MESIKCTNCGKYKPNEDYDIKKGLFLKSCKICIENKRKYREANRDKIRASSKEYTEANKERIKQYTEANKERIKQYTEANKERIKTKKQEYLETNKDKIAEKAKKWYELNKEKRLIYSKNYQIENRERINEQRRRNYHEKKLLINDIKE